MKQEAIQKKIGMNQLEPIKKMYYQTKKRR